MPEYKPPVRPTNFEFATTAGPGRLMNYGMVDNPHTLHAKHSLADLKAKATYGEVDVSLIYAEAKADTVTGQ